MNRILGQQELPTVLNAQSFYNGRWHMRYVLRMMANIKIPGRLTAVLELAFFVGFALTSKKLVDPYLWKFSGPLTLIATLLLLTAYMRMRGESWATMGLIRLSGIKAKLMIIPQTLLTFVAFAAAVTIVVFGVQALGHDFMSGAPDSVEERWGDIEGNLPIYLLWMLIVWTAAAFGEEMFFRGFLITRSLTIFSGVKIAPVLAVVLPAALFGYGHMYYQGWRGFFMPGAIAIAFGAMFLLFKRNLYPAILVHGIVDSIGFTARYMDWDV